MRGRLTARRHAIVTLNTISGNAGMIKCGPQKTRGGMAQVALRRGRDVVG